MDTSDGLRHWEQRVPHFEFLSELFSDEADWHRWDMARMARFLRFRQLLMRNWEAMKDQARQMANHTGFQKLWKVINTVKDSLKGIWDQIERAAYRRSMFNQFAAVQRGAGMALN